MAEHNTFTKLMRVAVSNGNDYVTQSIKEYILKIVSLTNLTWQNNFLKLWGLFLYEEVT